MYRKYAIVIVLMTAVIVLIQCTKTFDTHIEPGTIEEKQSVDKNKSLIAQGKKYSVSMILLTLVFGVDCFT